MQIGTTERIGLTDLEGRSGGGFNGRQSLDAQPISVPRPDVPQRRMRTQRQNEGVGTPASDQDAPA